MIKPLFTLGQIVSTPGAIDFMEAHNVQPMDLLKRHLTGDWGDLDASDKAENDHAVKFGDRIFSSYKFNGEKVWVITECDRSATTFLLPSEY
jgi:hypothetical protein